jgi:integrase
MVEVLLGIIIFLLVLRFFEIIMGFAIIIIGIVLVAAVALLGLYNIPKDVLLIISMIAFVAIVITKSDNPASQVKQLKVDNVRERYLTLDEIKELEEYIENHDNFLSHRELIKLFVKLSLTTGARLMGILSIKKKDIDLSHGSVNINDFKRGNTYKGFLTDTTKELLKERIKKLKANDYIFTVDGKAFTDRQLQGRLKPIIDKLFNSGLDNDDRKNRAVIHTLRHTFASHLAINGTPIFTIQKLMNHADINQTLRYAKLAPDSGMESVKNLYN